MRDSEDLHGFYILWMCFYKIVYWVIVLYWYFCIYFNLMYAYYFGLSGESSSYDALWCRCSMMSKPVSMSAACSYAHGFYILWMCFYKIVYWVIVLYWYFCIYFNLMYAYYFGLSGESSSYDALWCRCSMMSKPVSMSAACSYVPWHPSHHEWKCNPEVCRPLTLPSHAFALHALWAYKFVTNKL